jgi:hypothetical protein
MMTAFPIDEPTAFGTSPMLAPSRPLDPAKVNQNTAELRTTWQRGDCLYLASDALAHWFLNQATAGGRPWRTLWEFGTDDAIGDFAALVDGCRANGSIKNDDTTLVRIDIL